MIFWLGPAQPSWLAWQIINCIIFEQVRTFILYIKVALVSLIAQDYYQNDLPLIFHVLSMNLDIKFTKLKIVAFS